MIFAPALPYLGAAGLGLAGYFYGKGSQPNQGGALDNTYGGYNPSTQPILTTPAITEPSQNRRDGVLMNPVLPNMPTYQGNPHNAALGRAMSAADKGGSAMLGGYFTGLEDGQVNKYNAETTGYANTVNALAALQEAKNVAAENQPQFTDPTYTLAALDALDQAAMIVQDDSKWTTGIMGVLSSMIPDTAANDLKEQLVTVESSIGFQRLEKMREQSATGASGLGSLSKNELDQLNASVASLKISQSKGQFTRNLRKVRMHYVNFLMAVDAERQAYNQMIDTGRVSGAKLPRISIPVSPFNRQNNQGGPNPQGNPNPQGGPNPQGNPNNQGGPNNPGGKKQVGTDANGQPIYQIQ